MIKSPPNSIHPHTRAEGRRWPKQNHTRTAGVWLISYKKGTGWSKIHKARTEKMIQAGRMTSAGLAKLEAAKRDGSWTALDAIEALEISPDLAALLAADPSEAR